MNLKIEDSFKIKYIRAFLVDFKNVARVLETGQF